MRPPDAERTTSARFARSTFARSTHSSRSQKHRPLSHIPLAGDDALAAAAAAAAAPTAPGAAAGRGPRAPPACAAPLQPALLKRLSAARSKEEVLEVVARCHMLLDPINLVTALYRCAKLGAAAPAGGPAAGAAAAGAAGAAAAPGQPPPQQQQQRPRAAYAAELSRAPAFQLLLRKFVAAEAAHLGRPGFFLAGALSAVLRLPPAPA